MKEITKDQIQDPIIQRWISNYKTNKDSKIFDQSNSKPLIYLYNNFYYNQQPIILISAGPSLDDNISKVKSYQNNAIIICVDLALYAVQQAGITPDFVVTVDSSEYISEMWKICDTRDLKLVCPTTTHPWTISNWEGSFFFYNQMDDPHDPKGFVLSHLVQPTAHYGNIPNKYFVGATALQFLQLFRPSVTILAGYDFGYKENKIYCKGVMESRVHYLYGTDTYNIEKEKKIKKVLEDAITVDGVLTSEMMSDLYLKTFLYIVQVMKLKVVNSTEGGILNLNNMKLEDSLNEYCNSPIKKWDTTKIKKRKRRK